jgi:hypothetical protein
MSELPGVLVDHLDKPKGPAALSKENQLELEADKDLLESFWPNKLTCKQINKQLHISV